MPKFTRGWVVTLKDGTKIFEGQMEWREVPKKDIKILTLRFDGRKWSLSDKQAYFVKNRASMVPGINESFQIEQRCIGFYEGATKIHYVVDEFTGHFEMRVEDNSK